MAKISPAVAPVATGPAVSWDDEPASEEPFVALTADEARAWRARQAGRPLVRALAMQLAMGVLVTLVAWWVSGRALVAGSAAYGALAGGFPAALAAWRTARWAAPGFPPGAALAGLLVWEGVKIALTVGMLMAAPKFLGVPDWPALLIGLALTIKMYWVGLLAFRSASPSPDGRTK